MVIDPLGSVYMPSGFAVIVVRLAQTLSFKSARVALFLEKRL